jgi:hypothetical protein
VYPLFPAGRRPVCVCVLGCACLYVCILSSLLGRQRWGKAEIVWREGEGAWKGETLRVCVCVCAWVCVCVTRAEGLIGIFFRFCFYSESMAGRMGPILTICFGVTFLCL